MRAVIGFLVGIIAALVALSLGVIVVQNSASVDVTFLGRDYEAPSGWLLLTFSAVGFVVAFLLLIPGRLATAWRSWSLSKQTHRLQDKLVDVQTQYALLEGEVRLLRAERQQIIGVGAGVAARPAAFGEASVTRAGGPVEANTSVVSPSPRTPVAVADRPAPKVVTAAPAQSKMSVGEQVRVRVAMARGRLKARLAWMRKRSSRKTSDAA